MSDVVLLGAGACGVVFEGFWVWEDGGVVPDEVFGAALWAG